MQKDTSRNAALDYLLAIGNLIALADHKEEQIMNLMEEHDNVPTLKDTTPEETKALQEQIRQEIVQATKERQELYDLRRDLQRNFFERYKIDNDYRCQFKHYAIALTAAEECRNADPTFQNDVLVTSLRKLVYQFLWTAMWVWPANCWRCLADLYEEAKESKHNDPKPALPEKYWWPFRVFKDWAWWVRKYIVVNTKTDNILSKETHEVEKLDDTYTVYCRDVSSQEAQIVMQDCTPIEYDILEPTPMVYSWTQSDIIFNPEDYSGSQINEISNDVIIPKGCWWHEEYRKWDWGKITRYAVIDWYESD